MTRISSRKKNKKNRRASVTKSEIEKVLENADMGDINVSLVVKLVNVVQPDNFFTFSKWFTVSNLMHISIIFLEFWQFCAFSFDPSIPWSNYGGVSDIQSVSYIALMDMEGLEEVFDVEIPISEDLLMGVSGFTFFLSILFLITVRLISSHPIPTHIFC